MRVKKVVGLGVALVCSFGIQLLDNPLAKLGDSGLSQKTTPLLAQKTLANSAPLLVAIRREGGLCQRMGCFSEVAILSDGTYRYTTHQSRPVTGRIATRDLQQLQTQIKNTNFALLRSQRTIANPRPDLCLLPVDGPEAIYRFSTNNRIEEIRGCQTQIDANNLLFKQLEQLYQQISEQASQEAAIAPSPLPEVAAETVRQTFLRDYGNRLTNLRVTSAQPMTWSDCLPDRPNNRYSYQPCQQRPRSGWRVSVQGEFTPGTQKISRVYYTDGDKFPWGDSPRFAVLDTVSSLTDPQRDRLATQLKQRRQQLQIIAAQEESLYPATACPPTGFCAIPPTALGWRVLVQQGSTDRIVRVSSLGTPLNGDRNTAFLSDSDRKKLGSLPLNLANAVMRDANERFITGEIFPDPYPKTGVDIEFRLDSVRSIAWNECQGNGGPSRPAMGICPDVTRSGWRMVVRGGLKQNPFHLVYYIPRDENANSFIPKPDGLQSLPNSVQTKILQTISKQIEVPVSGIHLHWAEAKLFDRCLNVKSPEIRCKGEIRPGWRIEVLANSPLFKTTWGEALWVYHTNLTGSEVHSISRGAWAPPPAVRPPAS